MREKARKMGVHARSRPEKRSRTTRCLFLAESGVVAILAPRLTGVFEPCPNPQPPQAGRPHADWPAIQTSPDGENSRIQIRPSQNNQRNGMTWAQATGNGALTKTRSMPGSSRLPQEMVGGVE